MVVDLPDLTEEQRQELDAVCANKQLLEFMEAGLPNRGEIETDEAVLERQCQAIEAFSKLPESFWSFK